MLGLRSLTRCGLRARSDWLCSPLSLQPSVFAAFGRRSASIRLPELSSRGWSWWQPGQEGAKGHGGLPVTPHGLRFPAAPSPLPKVSAEQGWEGEGRLGWQPDTGENRRDRQDEKVIPCCGISLISLLASFEPRNLGRRDIASDTPSAPPEPPFFRTARLVPAAAALYLFASQFLL